MKFITVEPKNYLKLRLFATLIDALIFGVFAGAYLYVFDENPEDNKIFVSGALTLPLLLLWLVYFPILESINGATPGHDICKLTIVGLKGEKITFSTAFKRRICDVIDLGLYGLPALICISKTEKHQRLGDLWAGTLVVRKTDMQVQDLVF